MHRTLKKILRVFTIIFLIVITLFIYDFAWVWIVDSTQMLLRRKVLRIKDVAKMRILDTDEITTFPYPGSKIEIYTNDGYKIFLYDVTWELKNKNYTIYQINDIACHVEEFTDESGTYLRSDFEFVFEKITGKKLKSISDIVDNREELYELFEFLESNLSKDNSEYVKKFTYNGIYTIKADFAKKGSEEFDRIQKMYIYD